MSLDLYIKSKTPVQHRSTGVYVRENGITKETSLKEAKEKFPWEDIEEQVYEDNIFWHGNITHNLTEMADHVDLGKYTLYNVLWHPEDVLKDLTLEQYIHLVLLGYVYLSWNIPNYEQYDPKNGWGSKELLVSFTKDFLLNLIDAYAAKDLDIEIIASR